MPDVTADPAEPAAGVVDRIRPLVPRYVPITAWARSYPREWLRPDLIAAVTSWVVMVPVALAYAGLAGVPPEVGLTTAFAAMAVYAVFGTSRHLKVTASSTMAIMSAAVVVDLAGGDPALFLLLTAALAMTVGVLLLVAGVARLGFVADFLTKSVVTGFIFGLAITIVVGQLPKLLGVPSVSGSVPDQLRQLIAELPNTDPYTLAIGLVSLALIVVLRVISRRIPGPLIALVLGLVAVPVLNLQDKGVSVVGAVATGLPSHRAPDPADRLDPGADPRGVRHRVPRGRRVGRRGARLREPAPLRDRRRPGAARAGGGEHRQRPVRRLHRPTRACPRPPRPRRQARSRSCRRS